MQEEEGGGEELLSQGFSSSLFTLELVKAQLTSTASSQAFSEWHSPLRAHR